MLEALEQNFKRFQGWLNAHAIERAVRGFLPTFIDGDARDYHLTVDTNLKPRTDGKRIFVSLIPDALQSDYGTDDWLVLLRAITAHEAQHTNSSNFSDMEEIRAWYGQYMADNFNIKKSAAAEVAGSFLNIVEDGRIESIAVKRRPGMLIPFIFLNEIIRKGTVIEEKAEEGDIKTEYSHFFGQVLSYAKTGLYAPGIKAYVNTEFENNFLAIRSLIDEGVNAITSADCKMAVQDILIEISPYLASLLEQSEELQDELEDSYINARPEYTSNGEKEFNDGQSQQSQQNNGENGKSSNSLRKAMPVIANNRQKQSDNGNDEDNNADNNADGSSSASSNTSDDNTSNGGTSNDGTYDDGSSDNNTPDDRDTDAGTSNSGVSDDGLSDKNTSDGNTDDGGASNSNVSNDNNSESSSDSDGSSKDTNGDTESNDTGNGSAENSSENSAGSNSGNSSNSSSCEDTSYGFDNSVDDNASEISEDRLNAIKVLLSSEVMAADKSERAATVSQRDSLTKGEINAIRQAYQGHTGDVFIHNLLISHNEPLPQNFHIQAVTLRREIMRIIKSKQSQQKYMTRGVLDHKALWRSSMTDKVFYRKRNPDNTSAAFYLLIDNSGSMDAIAYQTDNGYVTKYEAARSAAAVIEDAVQGLVPCKIALFDQDGRVANHIVIRNFEDRDSINRSWNSLAEIGSGYCNADSVNIRISTSELLKRQEKRKILFLLSDGTPSAYSDRTEAKVEVREAVKDARRKGCIVIPIMFGDEDFQKKYVKDYMEMYEKHIISCLPQEITFRLAQLFKTLLKN